MERLGIELYIAGVCHKGAFEGWVELSEAIAGGNSSDFHVKRSRLD